MKDWFDQITNVHNALKGIHSDDPMVVLSSEITLDQQKLTTLSQMLADGEKEQRLDTPSNYNSMHEITNDPENKQWQGALHQYLGGYQDQIKKLQDEIGGYTAQLKALHDKTDQGKNPNGSGGVTGPSMSTYGANEHMQGGMFGNVYEPIVTAIDQGIKNSTWADDATSLSNIMTYDEQANEMRRQQMHLISGIGIKLRL